MVRNLHFVVFFIITFSSLTSEAESNTTKVDIFQELTSKYLNAYNQSNFSLLANDIINQQQYNAIVSSVEKKNEACLTDFDKNFDVNIFKRAFEKSHLYQIKSDTIVVESVTSFATCADLDIKKLSCFVYFKKKNASVPITLIVIKTDTDKYKILLDIINENYFSNEKN